MRSDGFCVWFTGLPCSGKTTLSKILSKRLSELGYSVVLFDGDTIRATITKGLGFSKEDRIAHILRVGEMALEEVSNRSIAICALVSPYEEARRRVCDLIGKDRFVLVYLNTPLTVCEKRDVKGMYCKARRGEIKSFTGIDDPYEPPIAPDLIFDTSKESEGYIISEILNFLSIKGFTSSLTENFNIYAIIQLAKEAGIKILDVYKTTVTVKNKDDGSPLTEADRLSHNFIYNGLKALYPSLPIISEESDNISYEERKKWEYFWLVDPLDGTKEFIKGNGEFTINIALIQGEKPVIGVIYAPVKNELYFAVKGKGAFKTVNDETLQYIRANRNNNNGLTAVCSRSHTSRELEDYLATIGVKERISAGSSLKFCLVSEGKADLYPRLGTTMEWDTAAGQIIVEEAGGEVVEFKTQKPLTYNKETLKNPYFIARRRL